MTPAPPSPAAFAILRYPDGWRILSHGRTWGRFGFRVEAEEAALRLADQARAGGQDAVILVQETFGELHRLEDGGTTGTLNLGKCRPLPRL